MNGSNLNFTDNFTGIESYIIPTNSTDAYPPESIRTVFTIVYGILSIIGIVGNVMVIFVVIRVRNMLTPTNCYLVSLAASDCLFFLTAAPVELAYLHLPEFVYPFSMIGCRVMTFLPFLAINASSLSITAFTIERYIGICHPMRARYLCTVRRARIIISCIWIFTIIYNSPWLFLATLKPVRYLDLEATTCTFKIKRQNWSYKMIFLGDFFGFYVIPMLLYVVLYGNIAFTLTTAGMDMKTNKGPTRKPVHSQASPQKLVPGHEVSPRGSILSARVDVPVKSSPVQETQPRRSSPARVEAQRVSLSSRESTSRRSVAGVEEILRKSTTIETPRRSIPIDTILENGAGRSEVRTILVTPPSQPCENDGDRDTFVSGSNISRGRNQVVKMLAVIVTVFAVCWLPYRAMVMYNSFALTPWSPKAYIFFAKTMIFINCAINPVLYNLMSVRFRGAFASLLKHGCRKRRRAFGETSSLLRVSKTLRTGDGSRYQSDWNSSEPSSLRPLRVSHSLGFGPKLRTRTKL